MIYELITLGRISKDFEIQTEFDESKGNKVFHQVKKKCHIGAYDSCIGDSMIEKTTVESFNARGDFERPSLNQLT